MSDMLDPAESASGHERVGSARDVNATSDSESVVSPTSIWSERRLELRRWLDGNAPGLTPVYVGAVHMASDASFPGRLCFVAHAMREIRNRLPDAIAGEVESSQTQYSVLADEVHARWIDNGLPEDGSLTVSQRAEPSASDPTEREVSMDFLVAVGDLIRGHLAGAERSKDKARRLFESVGGGTVPDYVVRTWRDDTRWATKFAHVHNKSLKESDEAELTRKFEAFEEALIAIANRSFENMDEIDEILDSANR